MSDEGYTPVRAQFFCRACGGRFTVDAEVASWGYRVAHNEATGASDDECPHCGNDDTAIYKTKPRKAAKGAA